jgi:hypothetical protein
MTSTTKPNLDTATFISFTLVTDTRVYEIVRRTAKSIYVRPAKDGGEPIKDMSVDGATSPGCPPVVWTPQVSDPDADTIRLGLRKDGTYRTALWASPLRPCPEFDGKPCRRTDYRF